MLPKTGTSIGHADATSQGPLDVLIVTATREEYEAVLKVDTEACTSSSWELQRDRDGREFFSRSFRTASGGTLRVAVVQALEMGEASAVSAAAPLATIYRPRCLAMCGVCAGRRGRVELGDVLIAERLWNYEPLKYARAPDGAERFEYRPLSYGLHRQWLQPARAFQPHEASPWLSLRPRTYEAQGGWLLERLLQEEEPSGHAQRQERCPDYLQVAPQLLNAQWVHVQGGALRLTEAGRQHIERLRALHPEGLPEPRPLRAHVGVLATGHKVVRDATIFERLSDRDSDVLGLEMEAAAIAAFAHQSGIEFMITMKGVMDFADGEKNDHFKHFAARASAECLLEFLRKHLPAAPVRAPRLPARPVTLADAMAEYKRASAEDRRIRCHDLRTLIGITAGSHQTELELLDFAVAPSLHDDDEEDSREAMLQSKLRGRDLSPAQKRELEKELRQLDDRRWAPHGVHLDRRAAPISFAEALCRYKRFVVIGDPGTGKSVLTRLAFLACMEGEVGHSARRLLGADDPWRSHAHDAIMSLREMLPVRLSLGGLGSALAKEPGLSFTEYLRRQFPQRGPGEALRGALEALHEHGQLLLLCDGLDEAPEAQRRPLVDALTEFLDQAPDVRFLLTSRPHGYRPQLPGLRHTRLATLDPWQRRQLVSRLHRIVEARGQEDADSVARAHRRTQALLQAVRKPGWDLLSSNPLLLTLTALTRTDDDGVPRHRVIVFENFVLTLLGEWRLLARTAEEAERLLDVWASAALVLVRQEKRHGVVKGDLLDILKAELAARPQVGALTEVDALHLALEAGLVRQEENTVSFWHSMFAEFLAAHTLTRRGQGAAARLLEVAHLSPLVLQLAAARLSHVLGAHKEIDTLITGLLARDERGAERLLRSGLRAASGCLVEGVSIDRELVLRVWTLWAEFLERTPPSPAWRDFERLAEQAPPVTLPEELLERFARLDDQRVSEVQHGVARLLVLSSAALSSTARDTCLRVVQRPYYSKHAFFGALGLASTGDWSPEVIRALGRLGERGRSDVVAASEQVRRSLRYEPRVRDLLRELVRSRLPSEEPRPSGAPEQPTAPASKEEEQRDLRLSAACLLGIGGEWDDEVARVLAREFTVQTHGNRMENAKDVVRHCAEHPAVHESLLAWAEDDSELGRRARELVTELAPFIDGLPEKALERTVRSREPSRRQLEAMMASVGEQHRSLLDTLRSWLGHEAEVWRFCAARILRQLAPQDEALHAALRRGMASGEQTARVCWAHLAFEITDELTDAAVNTLQECARSPDPAVREAVYAGDFQKQFRMRARQPDGWLACASDSTVPGAARLDAVIFLMRASVDSKPVRPLLRPLLDSEDLAVCHRAASILASYDSADARAAAITAEEAARTLEPRQFMVPWKKAEVSFEVTKAILRGLPREPPSTSYKEWNAPWMLWGSFLAKFAPADLSCTKDLIEAVELPGFVGEAATYALKELSSERPEVRLAISERLAHSVDDCAPEALFRLVTLGLERDETRPLAIKASRVLDPDDLSQEKLNGLALSLHRHAPDAAALLWRRSLQGGNPWCVLEAACGLARYLPEAMDESFRSALLRLLDAREPLLRAYTSRIALTCTLLEAEALAALSDCLELREAGVDELPHPWLVSAVEKHFGTSDPPGHPLLLEVLQYQKRRMDFEAMYALLVHRPELGVTRLKEWLEDPEWARFSVAVKLLVAQGQPREQLSAAFLARVTSAPAESLFDVTALADELGFYYPEMVERVLARYEPGNSSSSELLRCLHLWAKTHPEVWTILLRQDRACREAFDELLLMHPPPSREVISFAVDSAIRHSDDWFGPPAKWVIDNWCRPSQEGARSEQQNGEPPPTPPERVQGWLREVLLEQAPPNTLDDILCVDNLAASAELSPSHRLQFLSRALAVDLGPLQSSSRHYLEALSAQAAAAIRMLRLHGQDERILPILQTAFHAFIERSVPSTLAAARALLTLQPADDVIRQGLLRTLSHSESPHAIGELLDLLGQAGLSREAIVDVVSVCLGVELDSRSSLLSPFQNDHWLDQAPAVFEALEKWGCPLPLQERLLERFILFHAEALPLKVAMELTARTALSPALAIRLHLIILARVDGFDTDKATRQWLERFALRQSEKDSKQLWLPYWKTSLLMSRTTALSRLAQVDDPALVDRILAELALVPVDAFLALYRRAREGAVLTDSEWAALVGWLSSRPGDSSSACFAREWLNLVLWNAQAPEAVASLMPSDYYL